MNKEQKEQLAKEYADMHVPKAENYRQELLHDLLVIAFNAGLNARDDEVEELESKVRELTTDKVGLMCARDSLRSGSQIEIESLRNEIANLRAELAKAKNPWRDASETPKEGEPILFEDEVGRRYYGFYNADQECYKTSDYEGEVWNIHNVVKYMPIPKNEKGGEV